ncbi:MAG TPA: hypothetical protein VIL31_07245 [Cyclobacteriaceae bacterium]|jgi:hypothetical protein|nr:MAG: hypothetical protein DIU61_18820 [Bacteroidota bacterium]
MKRYTILYILMISVTLGSFMVMLRTITAEAKLWQILTGTSGFLLTLTMAVFFLIRLRKMRDG